MPTYKITAVFSVEKDEKPDDTNLNQLIDMLSDAVDNAEIEFTVEDGVETEDDEVAQTENEADKEELDGEPIADPISVGDLTRGTEGEAAPAE